LTGRSQVDVANFYLVFDAILAGRDLRQTVFALDNRIPTELQYQLLLQLEEVLRSFCVFALQNGMGLPACEEDLQRIDRQLKEYTGLLPKVLPAETWALCQDKRDQLLARGLPEAAALKFAALDRLADFLPLICMAQVSGENLEDLARIMVLIEAKLDVTAILQLLEQVPVRDRWDRRAKESLLSSLHSVTVRIVQQAAAEDALKPQHFFAKRRPELRAFEGLWQSLQSETPRNFHPFTVLLRTLESFLLAK